MRRRIVIGAFAMIVVAGVLAFALSGPKKGSIEWHKKEYQAALEGEPLMNALRRVWNGMGGHLARVDWEKAREHQQALIDLGYWKRRVFSLANGSPTVVMRQLFLQGIVPESELYTIWVEDTNSVTVFAMPRYMPQFEAAVRTLDVP
jgi:hypothetical protein